MSEALYNIIEIAASTIFNILKQPLALLSSSNLVVLCEVCEYFGHESPSVLNKVKTEFFNLELFWKWCQRLTKESSPYKGDGGIILFRLYR